MRNPDGLSHHQLLQIVESIHSFLYLDLDEQGSEYWNPDDADEECECQQPGHFCCGVPGILAHVESNRLAPGCKVERCDLCQRYPSDQSALQKLIELGMA